MSKVRKSNFNNLDLNPCKEEAELSQKCVETELYDYTKCTLYFENYKKCKQFWGYIKQQRQIAGISPVLPTKAERDRIMKLRKDGIKTISCSEMDGE